MDSASAPPDGPARQPEAGISIRRVMREIEDEVRRRRRTRLVARGGPADYADSEVYAAVESALCRAIERRERDVLLMPQLLEDEDWRLQMYLRPSSHRPVAGRLILFIKRRLLLPVMRWIYEYSLENFRRQDRLNRLVFACLEELAIENARLRQDLRRMREQQPPARDT